MKRDNGHYYKHQSDMQSQWLDSVQSQWLDSARADASNNAVASSLLYNMAEIIDLKVARERYIIRWCHCSSLSCIVNPALEYSSAWTTSLNGLGVGTP